MRGEDFAALVTNAKAGNDQATEDLIRETVKLLEPIARQFAESMVGIEADDLLQNGSIVLLRLLDRYDATKQSWPTFAVSRFKYACQDFGRLPNNRPTCNYRTRTGRPLVNATSIEQPGDNGKQFELAGYIDANLAAIDSAEEFEAMIGPLPRQAKNLMRLRYLDALTFREIGVVLRVSESRASQIHTESIRYLKEQRKP